MFAGASSKSGHKRNTTRLRGHVNQGAGDRRWVLGRSKTEPGWWNKDVESATTRERRDSYGEVFITVNCLGQLKDPRAKSALELTLRRWRSIPMENPQMLDGCNRAALRNYPVTSAEMKMSGKMKKGCAPTCIPKRSALETLVSPPHACLARHATVSFLNYGYAGMPVPPPRRRCGHPMNPIVPASSFTIALLAPFPSRASMSWK